MESVTSTTIMNKSLIQIKELFPPSKSHFLDVMEHLNEIIQFKESKNIVKIVNKLTLKLQRRKRKEELVHTNFQQMKDHFTRELTFKDNIILENCSLIIQQQRHHCEVMSKEKSISVHKISLNENNLKLRKEKLQDIINSKTQYFDELRLSHMQEEKNKRAAWITVKEILNNTLLRYDTEMMEQQNEIEFIQKIKESEEKELEYYKNTCASQEISYHKLMKEKEDYLEEERQKKLYEIRLKFAKRTIVKFVEQHYPAWKKKKMRANKKKGKYKYNAKSVK